jgi:hypothetical protein
LVGGKPSLAIGQQHDCIVIIVRKYSLRMLSSFVGYVLRVVSGSGKFGCFRSIVVDTEAVFRQNGGRRP